MSSSNRSHDETQGSNAQAWKYTALDGLGPSFDAQSMLSVEDFVNDVDRSVASSFEYPPANFVTPPTTYYTHSDAGDYSDNNQLCTANDTGPWGCTYAITHDGHELFSDTQLALGDQFAYQPHDQIPPTVDPLYYTEMPATSSGSGFFEDNVFASGSLLPEAPPTIRVEDTSGMRLWLQDTYNAGDRKRDDRCSLPYTQQDSSMPDSSLRVPYAKAEPQDDQESESSVNTSNTGLSCPNCSRAFENRDDLRRHRRYHDQRKHACHCGKRFVHPKDLRRHEQTHTPKEGVPCPAPHCTTVISAGRPDNLKRHVMKKHPDFDLASFVENNSRS